MATFNHKNNKMWRERSSAGGGGTVSGPANIVLSLLSTGVRRPVHPASRAARSPKTTPDLASWHRAILLTSCRHGRNANSATARKSQIGGRFLRVVPMDARICHPLPGGSGSPVGRQKDRSAQSVLNRRQESQAGKTPARLVCGKPGSGAEPSG